MTLCTVHEKSLGENSVKTVPGECVNLFEVRILVTWHCGRVWHDKSNCHCILDWKRESKFTPLQQDQF